MKYKIINIDIHNSSNTQFRQELIDGWGDYLIRPLYSNIFTHYINLNNIIGKNFEDKVTVNLVTKI